MTVISRLAPTIDVVVPLLRGVGLTVHDGPEPVDDFTDCVYIGYDGDPDGRMKQGDTDQTWAGTVGATRRDESFGIICAVVATRGDNDVKATRDAAYDLLGTVESTLRANPGLGFTSPYVAGVRPRETYMKPFSDGMSARVTFIIDVRTRV